MLTYISLAKASHTAKAKRMCYREGGSEYLSVAILSATIICSFITYLLSASIVLEIDLSNQICSLLV